MFRVLVAELGGRGVRANVVTPGIAKTPLTAQIKDHPEWYAAYADKSILGRWARPHELAGVVVFLASEVSFYLTGSFVLLDGGWTVADGRFGLPLCLFDGPVMRARPPEPE